VETRYTARPPIPPDYSAAPPPSAAGRWAAAAPRRGKWLIWLAALVALAVAVGIGGWVLGSGDYVAVPPVDGLKPAQAEQTVRNAGFTVTERKKYSDSRPVDTVLGTDPPAGSRVSKGSTVAVLISGGRPRVPALSRGADLAAVQQQIRDMGLEPVEGSPVYDDSVPSGTVASLEPAPGTVVPEGSHVTVHVSKGGAPAQLPDLRGHTVTEVTAMLAQYGAKVGAVTDESGNAVTSDAGTAEVTASDPEAGAGIGPGSVVNLTVAAGVQVPFVMFRSVRQAERELERAGLQAAGQIGNEHRLVTGQNPAAGSTVSRGTTVQLCTSLIGNGC
jgi:serine/threonine-protein kinase